MGEGRMCKLKQRKHFNSLKVDFAVAVSSGDV